MRIAIYLFGFLISVPISVLSATITVNVAGGGDFSDIQQGINAAEDSDTILVAPSEYVITSPITFRGKAITVRSSAGSGETIIRMSHTPSQASRASVVVFENSETSGSVLEGFCITGGRGTLAGGYPLRHMSGGGVLCAADSSPTLIDCTIRGNHAAKIWVESPDGPWLFRGGYWITGRGGGVYCMGSPRLINCTISGNLADGQGAGFFCDDSSCPTLEDCVVSGNPGVAIWCEGNSSPWLTACTIVGHSGTGVQCSGVSSPVLTNCIVWHNGEGGISVGPDAQPQVTFSCIEGGSVFPGAGNINAGPQFCGWSSAAEIYVDSARPEAGEGTAADPYAAIAQALDYSLALSIDSPCVGTGQGGENMGAERGTCESEGRERLVHLTPGSHPSPNWILFPGVNLDGAGEGETVIAGRISSMRTGTTLSNLAVAGGLSIGSGQTPQILNCAITADETSERQSGISCDERSAPTFTRCSITGFLTHRKRGGGISCGNESSPSFIDCTITANQSSGTSSGGGGVYCGEDSSPAFRGCILSDNWTDRDGGAVLCASGSTPTFNNCTIAGNAAATHFLSTGIGGHGGGVFSEQGASPTLQNCTITANWADWGGGLYCGTDSSPRLINCIVWDNAGESVWVAPGVAPDIRYSCLEGDEVWPGEGNIHEDPRFCGCNETGEVYVDAAHQGPVDGTREHPYPDFAFALPRTAALSSNSPCRGAGQAGVDIGADNGSCSEPGQRPRIVHVAPGHYHLSALVLHLGASIRGSGQGETVIEGPLRGLRTGAVLSDVALTGGLLIRQREAPHVLRCMISNSSSIGVRCKQDSAPTFTDCSITDCGDMGVHCASRSSPTLYNCTISRNGGRGMESSSQTTLRNCRITANAGVGISCGQSTALTNCLVTGNWNCGVYCSYGVAPRLFNCTIAGNGSGGVVCVKAAPTLTNCIVWANLGGSIRSEGEETPAVSHSCTEDAVIWPGTGNINADPLFVQAGYRSDNGTPDADGDDVWIEGDYHLEDGSPCIDTGISLGSPAIDLEGEARPCGAASDMGAYEAGGCPPTSELFVRGDPNADNAVDIADAIFTLSYLFAAGPAPSCLDAADANDDGAVDLADGIFILQNLYASGPAIPPPNPDCGIDPTVDELGCVEYTRCQ